MPIDFAKDILIRWDHSLIEQIGAKPLLPSEIQAVSLSQLEKATGQCVLSDGLWPGIRRPPAVDGRGDETASASREPWVDANGYLVGYLRALYPDRPAVLGYLPDKLGDRGVPYDSLELALIEAWVAGGNYILALEDHYRNALLAKDPKAVAAWQQLGRTARWLREHIDLFGQPSLPIVSALVESGAATAEISNLLYRRNVSPALFSATAPPDRLAQSHAALLAANLRPPQPESMKRILNSAEQGGTVVVAAAPSQQWWKTTALQLVRSEPDREFYALGKGRVIAYRRPIADPSEFALDVIDIITHKNRAARLWNAPAVVALATSSPRKGERLLHMINYGSPIDTDVQARVQGNFAKATLLRPDASDIPLTAAKRGTTTEVQVPELRRLGVVVFS